MKYFIPSYYKNFICKAGDCKNSCCRGWEIDIDDVSFAKFMSESGDLGEKLRANIDAENHCFKLRPGDICPFLKDDGLCELIIEKGEDYICQICSDHPRFRNFFSGRTEIGLGMSCEAAAELILASGNDTELVEIGRDPGDGAGLLSGGNAPSCSPEREGEILELREKLYKEEPDLSFWDTDWGEFADFLIELEGPYEEWDEKLRLLKSQYLKQPEAFSLSEPKALKTALRNFRNYLIFRNIPMALDEDFCEPAEAERFVSLNYALILAMLRAHELAGDDLSLKLLTEICRLWSAEIEYSDTNPGLILDELAFC